MSLIFKPGDWRRQPGSYVRLNRRNPLLRSLATAIHPPAGLYDQIAGQYWTTSSANILLAQPGFAGIATRCTQALLTDRISSTIQLGSNFTFLAVASMHSIVTGVNDINQVITQGKASSGWELNMGNGFGSSGDFAKPRFALSGATSETLWIDGIKQTATDPAPTVLVIKRPYVFVGTGSGGTVTSTLTLHNNANGSADFSGDTSVFLMLGWNRVLTDSEIISISNNPWQVFEPDLARRFHFFAGGAVTNTTDVFSAEFDREIASAALTQLHNVGVQSAEFDREIQSVSLAYSVQPQSAEFDKEISSVAMVPTLNVQSAEFDREITSASLANTIIVNSAEFDREIKSLALSKNIVAQSAEFDREITSVGIAETTIDVQSAEFDREFGSAQITKIITPQSAEFDFEIGSVAFPAAGSQDVDSPEFDWECGSPGLRQFMVPANTFRNRVKCVFAKPRRRDISCCS